VYNGDPVYLKCSHPTDAHFRSEGWLLLNSRPDELATYQRLKSGMSDFMDRLAKARTPEEQEELEGEYRQFKELQGRCERLLEAHKMMERCREDKDEALKVMLQASKDLDAARREEEKLAELISDDHIEADRVCALCCACFVFK
jgi:hypothetical protein